MRSIINRTPKALKVPLPGGRSLFLGPGGRGQVPASALDRPAFRKLIEGGEIELLGEDHPAFGEAEKSTKAYRANTAHPAKRSPQNKGDR